MENGVTQIGESIRVSASHPRLMSLKLAEEQVIQPKPLNV